MKTNGTRLPFSIFFVQLMLSLLCISSFAQPDYYFSGNSRISGTNRQPGSSYRFTNVRPGVDAIVRINALTGGLTLNDLDGASGFTEAFQPVITVPARSNGYAEFDISFVLAGTIIPVVMLEVPITPIDVDGRTVGPNKVMEYDMINWGLGLGSYVDYNLLGGELTLSYDPSWITGKNTSGNDYAGVDTSAKQAMFTIVVPSIPSIVVRVGADNQTNSSQQRLRSIYFKKFNYPFSYLSKPALHSFRGNEKNNKVELQWELSEEARLSTIIIEKASSPSHFGQIGEVWVNVDGSARNNFSFTDNTAINGQAYYRLKMVAANGTVQYSNILLFRSAGVNSEPFKIYPSTIQSSATVNVKATRTGAATFQLIDYSGRVVLQRAITVQEGDNNIVVNNMGNITAGNYVAILKTGENKIYNQKVFKQ